MKDTLSRLTSSSSRDQSTSSDPQLLTAPSRDDRSSVSSETQGEVRLGQQPAAAAEVNDPLERNESAGNVTNISIMEMDEPVPRERRPSEMMEAPGMWARDNRYDSVLSHEGTRIGGPRRDSNAYYGSRLGLRRQSNVAGGLGRVGWLPPEEPGQIFTNEEIWKWANDPDISINEKRKIIAIIEKGLAAEEGRLAESRHEMESDTPARPPGGPYRISLRQRRNAGTIQDVETERIIELIKCLSMMEPKQAKASRRSFQVRERFARYTSNAKQKDAPRFIRGCGSILIIKCAEVIQENRLFKDGHNILFDSNNQYSAQNVHDILRCFSENGEGDVQEKHLHQHFESNLMKPLNAVDILYAMREYLVFVRQDSVIPSKWVDAFIKKRKKWPSVYKIIKDFLSFENRETLMTVIRVIQRYYREVEWGEHHNQRTLAFFCECLTWRNENNYPEKNFETGEILSKEERRLAFFEFLVEFSELLTKMMLHTARLDGAEYSSDKVGPTTIQVPRPGGGGGLFASDQETTARRLSNSFDPRAQFEQPLSLASDY